MEQDTGDRPELLVSNNKDTSNKIWYEEYKHCTMSNYFVLQVKRLEEEKEIVLQNVTQRKM